MVFNFYTFIPFFFDNTILVAGVPWPRQSAPFV
jgi:hypothetical protein